MRHGHRNDDCESTNINIVSLNKANPRLNSSKFKLAYDAIERIKNTVIPDESFDSIISSPYIRCIETASAIETKIKIKINGMLGEVNHPKVTKQPIEEIPAILSNDLKLFFGTSDEEIAQIEFILHEETRGIGGSADQRYKEELTKIVNSAILDNIKNILIITHGDCLASVVSLCDASKSVYSTEYCSYVVANFDNQNGWTLQDKCYNIGIMDN